jgi:hypothetical protein
VVSYMTAEPNYTTIQSLTYGTVTHEDLQRTRASWGWQDVAASAFVMACIIGGYLYFRG